MIKFNSDFSVRNSLANLCIIAYRVNPFSSFTIIHIRINITVTQCLVEINTLPIKYVKLYSRRQERDGDDAGRESHVTGEPSTGETSVKCLQCKGKQQ